MALDTFSKSGVATYSFTRGNTYPIDHSYTPNQTQSISGGGTTKVSSIGSRQEFFGITLKQIGDADIVLLHDFFNNSLVNWGEQLFTWTNDVGSLILVRLWTPTLKITSLGSDINTVKMTLKVEN